jgi:hypothetical protein
MRGALPIALVAYLPHLYEGDFSQLENIFDLEQVKNYVVGVVMFSLIVNGLTIKPLIKYLHLDRMNLTEQVESYLMKIYVLQKSIRRVRHLEKLGEITNKHHHLDKKFKTQLHEATQRISEFHHKHPLETKKALFSYTFHTEKDIFTKLHEKKIIPEKVLVKLQDKLLEGLDLIEIGIFPKEFTNKSKVMANLATNCNKNLTLQQRYLYRKAREFANLEVLDQLQTFLQVPKLRQPLQEINDTYHHFYHKNKRVCQQLEDTYGSQINQFEEDLCYWEFLATEEDILKELEIKGKASPTVIQNLHRSLVTS